MSPHDRIREFKLTAKFEFASGDDGEYSSI